jgi:hypothetical protein
MWVQKPRDDKSFWTAVQICLNVHFSLYVCNNEMSDCLYIRLTLFLPKVSRMKKVQKMFSWRDNPRRIFNFAFARMGSTLDQSPPQFLPPLRPSRQ